ncbi:MAG: hypothetical protein RL071_4923 [Pseudomonadota bacterium]|jgi:hypothetical protein
MATRPPAVGLSADEARALLEQLDDEPEDVIIVDVDPEPVEDGALALAAPAAGPHRPAWSGEEGARPDARRLRAAEGERRIQTVIDALVVQLVQAGDLELKPAATPAAVSARLCAALRHAGGFTQFGRTAARVLMADPDVEELFIDDIELTRALEGLG